MTPPDQTMNDENARSGGVCRFAVGMAAIFLLVCAAWLLWLVLSPSHDAAEAGLHLPYFFHALANQLALAEPPGSWNIPWGSLAFIVAWILSIFSTGSLFIRRNRLPGNRAEHAVLIFATGFLANGTLIALAGLAGFASPLVMKILLVAMIIINWRGVLGMQDFLKGLRDTWNRAGWPARSAIVVTAAAGFLMLIPALTPPVQSDGVRYHLAAPQEFLKQGRIARLPLNAFSNFPFLVEMHYMQALGCGTPEATQLIHWLAWLFTSLAVYALARKLTAQVGLMGLGPSVLAGALYACLPAGLVLASWPFTDHVVAFYFAASLLALTRLFESPDRFSFLLVGLMISGLIGVKYTALPQAGILYLLAMGAAWKNRRSAGTAGQILCLHAACLPGLLWYVKNIILTGNPVYPMAWSLFHGGDWSDMNAQIYSAKAALRGIPHDPVHLLISPVAAVVEWLKFESQNVSLMPWIGWAALVGGFASCLGRRKFPVPLAICLFFAGAFWVMWFFTYQGNRLLLPFFAMALPACTVPLSHLSAEKTAGLRRVTYTVLLIPCLYGTAWATQWSLAMSALTPSPLLYLTGALTRQAYIDKSLTDGAAFHYLNQHIKQGEKVFLIGEHRIYGADFHAVWNDWYDTPALAAYVREYKITSVDGFLDSLWKQGITWIMINDAELKYQLETDFKPRLTPTEIAIFDGLHHVKRTDVETKTIPPGVLILHLKDGP